MRLWCAGVFLALGTATGLAIITQMIATMRYVADVSAGLLLLAIWGAWSLYTHWRGRRWLHPLASSIILLLAGTTVIVGLLLGLQGYYALFKNQNPDLFRWMVTKFSMC